MKQSSRAVLAPRHVEEFEGDTLFARLARAVCGADCLPRKELFESWEFARRVRRRLRGGRIVEIGAGHGLTSFVLLLLDPASREALCLDRKEPPSHAKVAAALYATWPELEGRLRFVRARFDKAALEATPDDLVVSVHGCGTLTDRALDLAIAARAPVAVLPCCHAVKRSDTGQLDGWLDGPLAVDVTRAARLRHAGYHVVTQRIPEAITPQNRLLMGRPE